MEYNIDKNDKGDNLFSGIINLFIGVLGYKFIYDIINYINSDVYNAVFIQKKFIYEFIIGSVLFLIVFIITRKKFELLGKIKYGLFICGSLLIFEAIFINWSNLTDDTKLVLTGIVLLSLIILALIVKNN